jgi:hypothetical protein
MNYQEKYLKYKEKYLNLKKQLGAGVELEKLKNNTQVEAFIKASKEIKKNKPSYTVNFFTQMIRRIYRDDELSKEITELTMEDITELKKNKNLEMINAFINNAIVENIINKDNINNLPDGLMKLLQRGLF